MTTYEVVTSFSPDGYKKYGKRFIETFYKHWPEVVKLIVYHENDPLKVSCLRNRNLMDLPSTQLFLEKYNNIYTRGRKPAANCHWSKKSLNAGYNFRFDAFKFFRKPIALAHALACSQKDIVFWIDADTVTFRDLSMTTLELFKPAGYDISRLKRNNYHSECGFIGYQVNEKTKHFCYELAELYLGGGFYDYKEWHDSYLFDEILKKHTLNIYDIPHTSNGHPFINSILGGYMDHLKGELRKENGKSFKADYK